MLFMFAVAIAALSVPTSETNPSCPPGSLYTRRFPRRLAKNSRQRAPQRIEQHLPEPWIAARHAAVHRLAVRLVEGQLAFKNLTRCLSRKKAVTRTGVRDFFNCAGVGRSSERSSKMSAVRRGHFQGAGEGGAPPPF